MAAPKGNQNNKKFKKDDVELRTEAYRQYCEWVASGKSKESFVFEHPTVSVTYKTMETYMREDPINFPPKQMEAAQSKSLTNWELIGYKMMVGEIPKCQPAIYQMFMRNKFGWDKDVRESSQAREQAQHEFNKLRNQKRPIEKQKS